MKFGLCLLLAVRGGQAFKIAVAGANGGLGRELVYQSVRHKWDVCAYTRTLECALFEPVRSGWFAEDAFERVPMRQPLLQRRTYTHHNANETYDALVLAVGGGPFADDTSDRAVRELCANLPPSCRKVCLVSAFGVGDSLQGAGVGIQLMSSWYLRDTYASKRRQERLVCALPPDVEVLILRPRALSFECLHPNPFSMSRKDLAAHVLEWVAHSDASPASASSWASSES